MDECALTREVSTELLHTPGNHLLSYLHCAIRKKKCGWHNLILTSLLMNIWERIAEFTIKDYGITESQAARIIPFTFYLISACCRNKSSYTKLSGNLCTTIILKISEEVFIIHLSTLIWYWPSQSDIVVKPAHASIPAETDSCAPEGTLSHETDLTSGI